MWSTLCASSRTRTLHTCLHEERMAPACCKLFEACSESVSVPVLVRACLFHPRSRLVSSGGGMQSTRSAPAGPFAAPSATGP